MTLVVLAASTAILTLHVRGVLQAKIMEREAEGGTAPFAVEVLEQRRDGGGLDRRGRLVADVVERPEHPLVDTEVGERRVGRGVR